MAENEVRTLTLCDLCATLMSDAYDMRCVSGFIRDKTRCDHCGKSAYFYCRYELHPWEIDDNDDWGLYAADRERG